MTALSAALCITQAITLILGFIVYRNNSKRAVNKQFFILSIHLTAWAFCVLNIIRSTNASEAQLWIRSAFFVTAFFPSSFTLLMYSIQSEELKRLELFSIHRKSLLQNLVAALLALTPFFMHDVISPSPTIGTSQPFPEAIYGPGYYIYVVYFIVSCILAGKTFYSVFTTSTGIERYELQFILYGFGASFLVGTFSALVLPIFLGNNQTSAFGPLGIILLDGIVAYGITTHKILGIATILQRITSYVLLFFYLCIVYSTTWLLFTYIMPALTARHPLFPHLVATTTITLSMIPVHGRFLTVANRLISTKTMDISTTMKQANLVFRSVTTIDALLKQFGSLLSTALNLESVTILIKSNDSFKCPVSLCDTKCTSLSATDPIVQAIELTKEPVYKVNLGRKKQTELNALVSRQFVGEKCNVAVGIFSKSLLLGIVLLGSRRNGQIYDKNEQDALQILCNQFAVALENAQMYTEMQDNKIRNEIMLDQLVSGVVVANPEGTITLFNHEAQRITAITEKDAIGKNIRMLPPSMFRALEMALQTQSGVRNVDATLFPQEETCTYVRMGTAYLFGHDGKPMGALMVCTDMTELKSLEEQVRRSDQLSSVGTLAAGMAHEIKNPLVTIKTFTQLLPKRYADEDFRKDFSSLVAQEVERIDGIVNDLLSFSKPAKPVLVPSDLHEIVGQTLKLVHEQMAQKNIALKESLLAKKPVILGDAKLLSQALINLNLNAIQAIDGGDGTITVRTTDCTYRFANGNRPGNATLKKCVRLQISDTGKGIEPKNLKKIFDPFFTSKSEGTGMGLSVAHGIIQEHHGAIEVESEPGRGTTFHIYIPVHDEVGA